MPRTPNQVAADFVKGRIGEEIVNQLFSQMGYEVLPIGVEHTNLRTLYQCKTVDYLFMQARRMPDYCLVRNNTYRYIEVKFRFKCCGHEHTVNDVIKTIFYTYYHTKKREDKKPPTQYTSEYGPFKDVLMIWLFRDTPCILSVKDIAKVINDHAVSVDWSIEELKKFIAKDRTIVWNKPTLFSSSEDKPNKLQIEDWTRFEKDYKQIMLNVFGPIPSHS